MSRKINVYNEDGLLVGQTIVPPIFVDPFTKRPNVDSNDAVINKKANNKTNSIDSVASDSIMAIQEVRESVIKQIKVSIKPKM